MVKGATHVEGEMGLKELVLEKLPNSSPPSHLDH